MFWREGRKDGQTSGFWRAAITAIECGLFAATTIYHHHSPCCCLAIENQDNNDGRRRQLITT